MGEAIISRRGGGDNLNFKVVGGTTQPSNPKENTIWVNTSTAIASYGFNAHEPSNKTNGMVWFVTGAGNIHFAALKKETIELNVIACKQYINNAWKVVSAKIYQSGWKNIRIDLYAPGDAVTQVTGGYNAEGKRYVSGGGYVEQVPTVTYNASNMVITSKYRYGYGVTYTKNKISLAGMSKIRLKGTCSMPSDGNVCLTAWTAIGSMSGENRAAFVWLTNGNLDISLDVSSLDETYYIGFITGAGTSANASVTVQELWVEA